MDRYKMKTRSVGPEDFIKLPADKADAALHIQNVLAQRMTEAFRDLLFFMIFDEIDAGNKNLVITFNPETQGFVWQGTFEAEINYE